MELIGFLIIGIGVLAATIILIMAGTLDQWIKPKSNSYKFQPSRMTSPAQSVFWGMGRTTIEWVNPQNGLTKFVEYDVPLPGFIPFVNTFPLNGYALLAGDNSGFEWISTNNPLEGVTEPFISKERIEATAMKCEEMLRVRSVDKQVISNLRAQLTDSIKYPTSYLKEVASEMANIRKSRLGRGMEDEFQPEGMGDEFEP